MHKDYYKDFYNSAPIGFFSEDLTTRKFIRANPAFLKMMNADKLSDLDMVRSLTDEHTRNKITQEIEKNGFIKEWEIPITTVDGQRKWWLFNLFCCVETDICEGAVIDITDKKQLELAINELKQKELESLKEIQAAINVRLRDFDQVAV